MHMQMDFIEANQKGFFFNVGRAISLAALAETGAPLAESCVIRERLKPLHEGGRDESVSKRSNINWI